MWFLRFLVLWFLVSTGIDCVRGEDIMFVPSGYSDEVTPLGWIKVSTAAVLTVILEIVLRRKRRENGREGGA